MLKQTFWQGFWNLYAFFYDTLTLLIPYRRMLSELAHGLRLNSCRKLLDAGCGTGNFCRLSERTHPAVEVTGIDRAGAMLRRARHKCRAATLQAADLDAPIAFEDGHFDAVACCNVLYSLPRPQATLHELQRVLRPGGRLVISNPSRDFALSPLVVAHLQAARTPMEWLQFVLMLPALAIVTLLNLIVVSQGRNRQFHFLEPDELQTLLNRAGFSVLETAPTYAGQNYLVVALKEES